ncbi:MAG: phosphate ABC transporter permease PstA [Clostridia bacterium]|nr:phosphate ABC transporter permease PstA [Clostridia bacterium]
MMKKFMDQGTTLFFWFSGLLIVAILVWFLQYTVGQGWSHISWQFLTTPSKEMDAGGGIGPELFNTFYVMVLSLVFSLPVGLGAGIYLAEYAPKSKITDLIRLSTESLASVPSIVFGLFGSIIFVTGFKLGFTILGGAATLTLLNLPVLVRVTEEAIKAVPFAYREASYALGATKWQTIYRVVLLSALPSLITGINLVAGRAMGESAILVFTAGLSVSNKMLDFSLFAPGETLAVHLWYVRAEGLVPDAEAIANGSAAVLVLVVLLFNLLIGIPSRILHRRFAGKVG